MRGLGAQGSGFRVSGLGFRAGFRGVGGTAPSSMSGRSGAWE